VAGCASHFQTVNLEKAINAVQLLLHFETALKRIM
jgi:hypothetical protein